MSEFAHRPGSLRRVELHAPAPADLGIEVVEVPAGADVEARLRLEAVVEGVLVTGTVRAPLAGECVRCLDPLDAVVDAELQELYAFGDRDATGAPSGRVAGGPAGGGGSGASDPGDLGDEGERWIEDDLVDLEPALRDAVVLALPQAPVCRADCPGLCAECGARLADDPGHAHASADPRWAALAVLAGSDRTSSTTRSTDRTSAGESGRNEEN